jgi:hypothetical protein
LILSNEEKTNDYENFEKGMIFFRLITRNDLYENLENRVVVEKRGGGNEIHAPCACDSVDQCP